MTEKLFVVVPIGLLPAIIFLVTLLYMDSYKLVSMRAIIWVIGVGGSITILTYFIGAAVLDSTQITWTAYTLYVAPIIEEILKASVIVVLLRTNRIGFLVDAAIFGFAVGTGFALVENLYYLQTLDEANIGVWIVRGFGTAIMHGGATAIFGILTQALTERSIGINPLMYLPGLALAIALHSLFNHFLISPIQSTMLILLVLPPVLYVIYLHSSRSMHDWLQLDFDADADLLEQINSSEFSESSIGRYLGELRNKFKGPVVVDMLCYLRLYTELALRAKGVLMMRENGFDEPVGERTRAKFEEMRFLEKSIGKTGRMAMRPFLHMDRKDLWQLYVLEK
ncbi:MAG: PrsW family glutamic-type intramembrane protease [Gammaproteobacteria bacterium]|nr:PrsW family glutamic-type intramembrane protease [Gammaproteobacteria bacterium]